MLEKIKQLEGEALAALAACTDPETLNAWRTRFLGRKGEVTKLLRGLGQLPKEERPAAGQAANALRQKLEAAFEERAAALARAAREIELREESVDVTLPGRRPYLGRLHPISQTLREIYDVFAQMGFQIYLAPEVETDENNFELLNIPPGHPARDMWDTFYTTTPGVLLRTHTSPGQIRAMREYHPEPIRVILPGLCYRYEQVTARSEMMFYQVEGLAIGRNITMADLKGVIVAFVRQLFGPERKLRFRCSHFPFTEPSAEVDMDCIICAGEGCRVCKYTGWLEIMGCGMVHPIVLQNGGYDPSVYSGFAFGMGPERIAMLKHGVDDIRYFYGNDLRFLEQFG
ncbi:MAG TPA: phenylalanine--tRNA ligase subunit alpha [Anaerolineae bacterium]|nr:phenylalanine--tRNA ligase subunit alpha [Anaerolineae bacterium]